MSAALATPTPLRRVAAPPPEAAALDDLLQRAYRYALSLTHDADEARDLVQDASLSVARRGGPWHAGYFLTAVRNRFLDLRRRPLLFDRDVDETTLDDPTDDLAPDDTAPFAAEALNGALGELREAEREVLYLHAVEGLTASEIGALTDRPRGTVLSLLHRTKKKLRARLGDDYDPTP
ncbi:MAG: RNA polymerase sigma factor [Bacteroidota bacterium]